MLADQHAAVVEHEPVHSSRSRDPAQGSLTSAVLTSRCVTNRTLPAIGTALDAERSSQASAVAHVGHLGEHDVGVRLAARSSRARRGPRPAAGRWRGRRPASSTRSSAIRPAAARMPPCRTPPPSILRTRRASVDEILAARDDRADRRAEALAQADLNGVDADGQRGGRHASATAAFHSRAPSRCTVRPASRAAATQLACARRAASPRHRPRCGCSPATAAWCAGRDSTARCRRSPREAAAEVRPGPASPSSVCGMPPASHAAVPSSLSSTCAPVRGEEPVAAAQVQDQRDQVAHGPAGHPQRGLGMPSSPATRSSSAAHRWGRVRARRRRPRRTPSRRASRRPDG